MSEPEDLDDLEDLEDESWKMDLETTLLEDCDYSTLKTICQGRPVPAHLRKDVWRICLNANKQSASFEDFIEVFNLAEQVDIRDDCRSLVDSLASELLISGDRLAYVSDFESILTHFSRSYQLPYRRDNGWLTIIRVLFTTLKLDRGELYAHFCAVHHRFVAAGFGSDNRAFSVFRLLLQYHDPELTCFLDTKKVFPDMYGWTWFTGLFGTDVAPSLISLIWDVYFLVSDPLLMFYMALVLLLNSRDEIMSMTNASKEDIVSRIRTIPLSLKSDDVEDFHELALCYAMKTPESFHNKYAPLLFGNGQLDAEGLTLLNGLCLPVTVHELIQARSDAQRKVKFLLVDCRPAEQYNSGHLTTAFYLDSELMLSNPPEFHTTAQSLLSMQRQALAAGAPAAGEHICFLSSGREAEDQVVHMVVAHFLQRKINYVSMVYGGYAALHEVLGPNCDRSLVSHDEKACLVCSSSVKTSVKLQSSHEQADDAAGRSGDHSVGHLFQKFTHVMKIRSSRVKANLINYVKNDATANNNSQAAAVGSVGAETQAAGRHISKTDRVTRPYRNIGNVFTIDDEGEEAEGVGTGNNGTADSQSAGAEEPSQPEMINVEVWMKKPDVLNKFNCRLLGNDGLLYPGYLLLTTTHLFVLRKPALDTSSRLLGLIGAGGAETKATMTYIVSRRPLVNLVKITSKKKMPDMITFHCMLDTPNGKTTMELDKVIIENAGDAARMIKTQIQKVLDATEGVVTG